MVTIRGLPSLKQVRDMPDGSARWIIKPSITNQAVGIAVIDSCAGLRACLEAAPDLREWVAQRYVERPLLIRGRKFHLRAYVLCVGNCTDPLPHHHLTSFNPLQYTGWVIISSYLPEVVQSSSQGALCITTQ